MIEYHIIVSYSKSNSSERTLGKRDNIPINKNNKTKKKFIISISIILSLLLICLIVAILVIKLRKKQKKEDENKNIINYKINYEEYKNELIFKTKVNDLKRISINQQIDEEMVINDMQTQVKLFRKTYYDIYIISENECTEQYKNYCNKSYTASIAMASQCLSLEEDDCEPKILVDLSSNEKANHRNLNEINNLKDIPIPLCFFNLTDTNIITSIKCPESLSQNIKDELLSDLYYFRPLSKKTTEKIDEMNITIKNDIKNITRKSQGLCDIRNGLNSFCDLYMVISKDSEENLLSFYENSLSHITTDKSNNMNKNKKTQLIDETNQVNYLNPDKYKSILDDLIINLNPYMIYEEKFSIFNISKNKRSLINNDSIYLVNEQSLFSKEYLGMKISLNLKYDSGINVESMKSFLNLKFDENENELVYINQFSDLSRAIKKLISLSKSGNYLAYQLYENLKNNLDDLTQEITLTIRNLKDLIIYKDLTEILDSTLSLGTIKILPFSLIEESNILSSKLNTIINQIEKGSLYNYTNDFRNNINYYFRYSFYYMNKTFLNLNKLRDLLNSQNNKFTEISNIYLNNTPSSYLNIIQQANNIYSTYEKKEFDLINNKIDILLTEFEHNYLNQIEKHQNIINNLNLNIKNKAITIENAEEEDYVKIKNYLNNSNNYTNIILKKIKEKIKTVNYNEYKLSDKTKNDYNKIINDSLEIAYKLDNDEIIDKIFDKIMINLKQNFTEAMKYMDRIKEEKFPLINDALKEDIFSIKDNINNDIMNCGVNIIKNIKNENDYYIKSIRENIDKFINENLENLP